MTKDNALKMIEDNYCAANDSFLFCLHERGRFCEDGFELLCCAAETLAGCEDPDTAQKINYCYQSILKELIYHFDPNDSSEIKDLPENYTEHLQRFDCALARLCAGGCGKRKER